MRMIRPAHRRTAPAVTDKKKRRCRCRHRPQRQPPGTGRSRPGSAFTLCAVSRPLSPLRESARGKRVSGPQARCCCLRAIGGLRERDRETRRAFGSNHRCLATRRVGSGIPPMGVGPQFMAATLGLRHAVAHRDGERRRRAGFAGGVFVGERGRCGRAERERGKSAQESSGCHVILRGVWSDERRVMQCPIAAVPRPYRRHSDVRAVRVFIRRSG
jgi:hypothetical protein